MKILGSSYSLNEYKSLDKYDLKNIAKRLNEDEESKVSLMIYKDTEDIFGLDIKFAVGDKYILEDEDMNYIFRNVPELDKVRLAWIL